MIRHMGVMEGLPKEKKTLKQLSFGELKYRRNMFPGKKPLDTQMNLICKIRPHIEFLV